MPAVVRQQSFSPLPRKAAGKWVGLANGKVVIVSEDIDEVDQILDEIEPDKRRVFIVDTSRDPNEIEYIWEMR
jgi:hypothetical protein